MYKTWLVIALTLLLNLPLKAQEAAANSFIVETATGIRHSPIHFATRIQAGQVLVMGEQHAVAGDPNSVDHQGHQIELLKLLTQRLIRRAQVHVGMEFLEYPKQIEVDQYLAGQMDDATFQTQVGWGNSPFQFYKNQILEPRESGGRTWAINSPRALTGQVAKAGIGSLTPEQAALLPPNFTRGNALYFERFHAAMAGHASEEQIENYFWAQSIWDDTMAWKTWENFASHSLRGDVMVIIVGEFHTQFGGGLPDRLKARAPRTGVRVETLVQLPLTHIDDKSVAEALAPDAKYGYIADFVWVYKTKSAPANNPKLQ